MKDKELNKRLREMAREIGMCHEFDSTWGDDDDMDKLFERFKDGIDFCIEHDFPPLDFITRNVSKEVLHKHKVYVNEDVDISTSESDIYVFMGRCKGRLEFKGFAVATVYLLHDSNIKIEKGEFTKVFIRDEKRGV